MRVSILYAVFGTALMASAAAIPVTQNAAVGFDALETRQNLVQSLTSTQLQLIFMPNGNEGFKLTHFSDGANANGNDATQKVGFLLPVP